MSVHSNDSSPERRRNSSFSQWKMREFAETDSGIATGVNNSQVGTPLLNHRRNSLMNSSLRHRAIERSRQNSECSETSKDMYAAKLEELEMVIQKLKLDMI